MANSLSPRTPLNETVMGWPLHRLLIVNVVLSFVVMFEK
jgi:hypothetical protein